MATCNFYANNVSRVFAFGMNKYISQEDIDANDWPDEYLDQYDDDRTRYDYRYEIDNVISDLQDQDWDDVSTGKYYAGEKIARKIVSLVYGGASIDITIYAQINGGYYEGACFDVDGKIEVLNDGGTVMDEYDLFGEYTPNVCDVCDDSWTGRPGLDHLQAENIIKRLEAEIERLRMEAEIVFSRNCEHELFVAWRAFNGETGYKEANKRICDGMTA